MFILNSILEPMLTEDPLYFQSLIHTWDIRYTFLSNHNVHKSSLDPYFWDLGPLI